MRAALDLLHGKYPFLSIAVIAVASYALLIAGDMAGYFDALHQLESIVPIEYLMLAGQIAAIALGAALVVDSRHLKDEIKRRRDAEAKAESLSQRDPLTGLANRRHVSIETPRLAQEAARSDHLMAALLIDLDRLKPVNDTLGHAMGDRMIKTVAERIRKSVQPEALVARIGGDEFAVVFDTDREEAAETAGRLAHDMLGRISKPMVVSDSQHIEISASIGVAVGEPDGDLEELLRHADQAMYCAKNNGRNQVAHFDEGLGELMRQRAALETDMLRALKNREFIPYFQPLFDLKTRKICGFEVLARWRHPERGLIAPAEFVPIAEETGMISELSECVLRQACRFAIEWSPKLTLAFNVSPIQFREKDLAARIQAVLAETGFPANRLEVELTENAIILDLVAARATIEALKATGVRIALDDFGTGYSSLSSLRQLPFDKVKIDRSFVTGAPGDAENTKIVEGILGLTRSLGLTTTAEGIESQNEEDWLRGLGCEQGQGFLFARPMSASEAAMSLDALADDAETEAEAQPAQGCEARAG